MLQEQHFYFWKNLLGRIKPNCEIYFCYLINPIWNIPNYYRLTNWQWNFLSHFQVHEPINEKPEIFYYVFQHWPIGNKRWCNQNNQLLSVLTENSRKKLHRRKKYVEKTWNRQRWHNYMPWLSLDGWEHVVLEIFWKPVSFQLWEYPNHLLESRISWKFLLRS
jgi:hypothetical protein